MFSTQEKEMDGLAHSESDGADKNKSMRAHKDSFCSFSPLPHSHTHLPYIKEIRLIVTGCQGIRHILLLVTQVWSRKRCTNRKHRSIQFLSLAAHRSERVS